MVHINGFFILITIFILIVLIGLQIYLSIKKSLLIGLVLPIFCNLMLSINLFLKQFEIISQPTGEVFFLTDLLIISLVLFTTILIITKLILFILKNQKRQKLRFEI